MRQAIEDGSKGSITLWGWNCSALARSIDALVLEEQRLLEHPRLSSDPERAALLESTLRIDDATAVSTYSQAEATLAAIAEETGVSAGGVPDVG